MNALHKAGMFRLTQPGTLAVLALLSQGAVAFAQVAGGGRVTTKTSAAAPRPDTSRNTATEVMIVRTTPRIVSLSRRLNELPVGSPEYFATEDSLHAAFFALPRPNTLDAGRATFSIQLAPSRVALRASVFDVIPQGWFGFLADGINRKWDEASGTFVQYFEYPTVVAIETNSPALKAGVRTGDSLVAYDGVDLRGNAINITRLLTPGREVAVKLRREGETKDVVISVERAPPSVMAERRSVASAGTLSATPRAPLMIDSTDRRIFEMRVAGAYAPATGMRTVYSAPTPRAAAGGGGAGGRTVATTVPALGGALGAAMTNVDREMSESLVGMKGKRGVLVTGVPHGSLAERTGLKPLDVILRVEDAEVMSINDLRGRLAAAEIRSVEKVRLLILRAGKTQELYWATSR